jgi:hypothetical protein
MQVLLMHWLIDFCYKLRLHLTAMDCYSLPDLYYIICMCNYLPPRTHCTPIIVINAVHCTSDTDPTVSWLCCRSRALHERTQLNLHNAPLGQLHIRLRIGREACSSCLHLFIFSKSPTCFSVFVQLFQRLSRIVKPIQHACQLFQQVQRVFITQTHFYRKLQEKLLSKTLQILCKVAHPQQKQQNLLSQTFQILCKVVHPP